MSWKASFVAAVVAAAVVPSLSYAQNGGGAAGGNNGGGRQRGNGGQGGQGQGGQGGQRGNFDPAEMMRNRLERMKENLAASDDEWKVIEPKLTKVMEAQRDVMAGMMGGMRGGRGGGGGPGGGGGGGGDQQPTTKIGIAAKALRDATQSDASSPEDIDKKLAAYRAAKAEAQTTLDSARKELKEVLTAKQEAILVLNNTLE